MQYIYIYLIRTVPQGQHFDISGTLLLCKSNLISVSVTEQRFVSVTGEPNRKFARVITQSDMFYCSVVQS